MRARPLLLALPLVAFAALAAVFAVRVTDGADRNLIPSPLIGKAAPGDAFPPLLDGVPGIDPAAFAGEVTLVNVFASWCAPCRVEHPELVALAKTPGLTIAGIAYKDDPDKGRAFLAELGNPYAAVGTDRDGRGGIDWGITGVPETFLLGPDGKVRAKYTGPLTRAALAGPFGEAIAAAIAERRTASK